VERAFCPDATATLDFALARLAGMMEKLLVYPERMLANLESLGGVVHSGEVLLALARGGISREESYAIVQRNAMATWTRLGTAEGRSFRENLDGDPDVANRVPASLLDAAMDTQLHVKAVDHIFDRVFGPAAE
jgi:adenylosuccinate lyase